MVAMAASMAGQEMSGERMRAHVKFLASDQLEGRGTGQRGGEIAVEYLASQLTVAGARRVQLQAVPLVGVQTEAASTLELGGERLKWEEEFVGHPQTQREREELDLEMVFVGHGIVAPEFGWNDYEGVDVRGKAVVLFTNEPPSEDPQFFGGRALTYYGRWTYKYEEALRRGAAAALIIHTEATAGYGWDVVKNSWGQEDAAVKVTGEALRFAGWISKEAAERWLRGEGHTVEDLLARANRRGFRAVGLKSRLAGSIRARVREMTVNNGMGMIEGSDPALREEYVVFTAHWDHLGKGKAIFNGAVDNASGCAVVLEIARAWAELSVKPRRSALFLFTAAEEAGLRGAEYFVAHPVVPLEKISLVLNFDSYFPFGRTRDVVVNGAERTTFWKEIQAAARRVELSITPDPRPEQGSFFRSDHFPFAKAGVAAFSVNAGKQFVVEAEAKAALLAQYHEQKYHQPEDDYTDEWDFAGMEQMAQFGMILGQEAGNAEEKVRWAAAAPVARKKKR